MGILVSLLFEKIQYEQWSLSTVNIIIIPREPQTMICTVLKEWDCHVYIYMQIIICIYVPWVCLM